jgi:hypothetical protein
MTYHNTPQLSRMDLPIHCAAFPGLYPWKQLEYNDEGCFLNSLCRGDISVESSEVKSVVSGKGVCKEKTLSVQLKKPHCYELLPWWRHSRLKRLEWFVKSWDQQWWYNWVRLNRPLPVLTKLPISTLKRREGSSPSLALLLCSQAPKRRHRVSKL